MYGVWEYSVARTPSFSLRQLCVRASSNDDTAARLVTAMEHYAGYAALRLPGPSYNHHGSSNLTSPTKPSLKHDTQPFTTRKTRHIESAESQKTQW